MLTLTADQLEVNSSSYLVRREDHLEGRRSLPADQLEVNGSCYLVRRKDHLEDRRGLPADQSMTIVLPEVRQPDVLVPPSTEHLTAAKLKECQ